ncbi:MAG TPA: AAA family ATPase [Jatrophihabitantaceae bacterium]|nr:AAA family ATPase [Jatrophihabitantaceae bacterium]
MNGHVQPGGLVGRDPQVAELLRTFDAVQHGPVGCAVHGPAGIGKTTLWQAGLAIAAGRGYHVLSCRPAESEADLSFAGLRDLLDDLPERFLAGLPGPQRNAIEIALLRRGGGGASQGHRAVPVGLLGLLRDLSAQAPVVIAVDDAQWLDPPTAQAIEYVARRLDRARVCVLVTVRSTGVPGSPFGLDDAFAPDRVVRIGLDGLSSGALHRLLSTRTPQPLPRPTLQRIEEASGGNPFFALELARAFVLSGGRAAPAEPLALPHDVSELLVGRIEQLPTAARHVLDVVAALAVPTVDVVVAALGEAAGLDGIALAEQHGVIEVGGGQIRLAHPLFGTAARPSSVNRGRMHARLAELVTDVEQRALHLALASERRDAQVADALEAGAAKAEERGAPTSAAQLWELASLRTPERDVTLRARRTAAAGTALFHAGDTGRARVLLEAAGREFEAGPERARVLLELADVAFHEGRTQRAVALCDRAIADATGDRLLQVMAGVRRCWYGVHDVPGQMRSIEASLKLLTDADAATDPELVACVWFMTAYYRFFNGRGIDRPLVERARELLRPDTGTSLTSLTWAGDWARMTWRSFAKFIDLGAVRAEYAAELAVATDQGDEPATGTLLMHLADVDFLLGEWQRARVEVERSAEIVAHSGSRRWRGFVLYAQGLLGAHAGELDVARSVLDEGLALATEVGDSFVAAMHLSVLGFVELCSDNAAEADRRLAQADDLAERMGLAEPARHRFHGDQVEAAVAVGDLERSAFLVGRLIRRAEVAPYPWLVAITARSRGILAMAQGDLDAAAAAFAQAMAAHDAAPIPFEQARTLLWLGRLQRRRKERLAAKTALSEAMRVFSELGAPLWVERAAVELQRLGLRRGVLGELTPTEEQIARLVAGGLTNKEVAAAAFVTVKTVEANLVRIYRKLGVASRRELIAQTVPEAPYVGTFPDSPSDPDT